MSAHVWLAIYLFAGVFVPPAVFFWWRNRQAFAKQQREIEEMARRASDEMVKRARDALAKQPQYVVTEKPKRKTRSDKSKPRTRLGPREKDITGQRFGLLVAVKRVRTAKTGHPVWRFKCDCGNHYEALKSNIASPSSSTVSCGCWKKEHMKSVAAVGRAAKAAKRKEMH